MTNVALCQKITKDSHLLMVDNQREEDDVKA